MSIMLNKDAVTWLKMQRQHLNAVAEEGEYEKTFSLFSPVHTKHWIVPGSPPDIEHRFGFDVPDYNRRLRRTREVIKGRFQAGRIAYVLLRELPLFIAAYKKDLGGLTEADSMVLDILRNEGPMNIKLIAEIGDVPSKVVAAALQRMQQAFLVFEDQVDDEWDRAWYLLNDELYLDECPQYTHEQAVEEIICRMAVAHVFLTPAMLRSFTRIKVAHTKPAFARMVQSGKLTPCTLQDQDGYVLTEDLSTLDAVKQKPLNNLYILDNNDYMVRAHTDDLKKRFGKKPHKNLYYVLFKGNFIGAVLGRFTFKDDELEDVQLQDAFKDDDKLKKRIIDEIYKTHDKTVSPLKKYAGKVL